MKAHVEPVRTYLSVFFALMLLTALTTAISFVDFGVFNDLVAMAIAGTKATLVIAVFMHVKHATPLIKAFAIAGFVWLALFMILILTDYNARLPVEGW